MRQMFEPHIVLTREPDGEYTLHAVTITPNTCYSAGFAEAAAPANVRLLPEIEPVLLHIRHRPGICLQVLKPVHHYLSDLQLGPDRGKLALNAYTVLEGRIVGSASIDVSALGRICPGPGRNPPTPLDTSDWYAWVNVMPPGPPSLHVQGIVAMGNPGYEMRLVPAAPQGINPRDLILDLQIEKKRGSWPRVVTRLPVRYDVENYAGNYDTVLVRLPGGSSIQLDLEKVS